MTLVEFTTRNKLRPAVAISPHWVSRVQRTTRGSTIIRVAGMNVTVAEPYESVVAKLRGDKPKEA